MKLKSIIRRIVPSTIWSFASGCKEPFAVAYTKSKRRNNLRKDWGSNSNIKIVFIVQRTEVFNSVKTVYEAAVRNNKCDVYLLPLPRCKNECRELIWETYDSVMEFCRNLGGGTVVESYNKETGKFVALNQLKPDYVFLNVPYTQQYPPEYSIENLAKIAKVCYIPYGYSTMNEKRYRNVYDSIYNSHTLAYVDYLFADCNATYNYCQKKIWLSQIISGKNIYNMGYPRFELLGNNYIENHNKFSALWIPRWTTEKTCKKGNIGSNFFQFREKLMNYASDNKRNFVLIIRPHPLAFENYIKDGMMKKEEVIQYKKNILENENIYLDENASYLNSFDQSDVLIADYSSIIIEYFIQEKPIIYCGEKEELSKSIQFIIDTFYYAKDWEHVQILLDQLREGKDPLMEKRKQAVEQFRGFLRDSGERILEILVEDCKN